jgi:hypothetical protein
MDNVKHPLNVADFGLSGRTEGEVWVLELPRKPTLTRITSAIQSHLKKSGLQSTVRKSAVKIPAADLTNVKAKARRAFCGV